MNTMPATRDSRSNLPAFLDPFMAMPIDELIARYRMGLDQIDPRLFELSDAQLDTAFLPEADVGRWPARVLIGHLADAELAFVHRLRRTVAEDRPLLATWDENAFIDAGLYGGAHGGGAFPIAGFLATIHTLRRWTSSWLLTLLPEQVERIAMHPLRGEQTVRLILCYTTWHLEHHADYLNRKIAKFLGPRPQPCDDDVKAQPGACGAGCGCKSKAQA
jgi:hypothetical protein